MRPRVNELGDRPGGGRGVGGGVFATTGAAEGAAAAAAGVAAAAVAEGTTAPSYKNKSLKTSFKPPPSTFNKPALNCGDDAFRCAIDSGSSVRKMFRRDDVFVRGEERR
jgi:hypothetical protein